MNTNKGIISQHSSGRSTGRSSMASDIHHTKQRSRTLSRQFVKNPHARSIDGFTKPHNPHAEAKPISQPRATIIKNPSVHARVVAANSARGELAHSRVVRTASIKQPSLREAPLNRDAQPVIKPIEAPAKPAFSSHTASPVVDEHIEHPIAKIAHQKQAAKTHHNHTPTLKTAREIKQEAIEQTLAAAPKHSKKQLKPQRLNGKTKLIGGLSAGLVSAFALAYGVYNYMPDVSMSAANAQAGIQAHYPNFVPAGYKVDGAVSAQYGRVEINFKSTTNDSTFKLIQVGSDWDSEALLANHVKPTAGNNFQTDFDRGLTVYSYHHGAAWVNRGILHIIESDSQLSPEQVLRMAASL